jgi:hypothetical protein
MESFKPKAHFISRGNEMPKDLYEGRDFTLDSANGEAAKLFGTPSGMAQPPKLRISIKNDAHVTFTVTGADAAAGRDFSTEAQARYIDGDNFNSGTWPDPLNDVIIGHINWKVAGKQQLFLMWVRDPAPHDPGAKLKLGFFFFANKTRFSCGADDMAVPGAGQVDGGGSGTGPK